MKKFCFQIALFLLPLLLVVLPPISILKRTGENFTDIDDIIQKNEKYLIGYVYNEKSYNYLKWKTVVSHDKCEVWTLGSSRVLQFRSQMFAKSFYNAGYTIASLGEFVPFLKSVPKEKHPEYLIINLDQWMFNETWDKLDRSYDKSHWSDTFQKNANLSTMISVWKDIFAKKYSFQITKNENVTTIGLNACFNNTGFRNDGSMWYGGQIKKLLDHNAKANDFECKETLQRIVTGTNRFEFGNTINPKALKALDELLKYCKQQNIQLISFIPPFADKVNEALSKSNHHQYMDLVTPACLPIFKKYDDEFYDFRYLKSIDSNDTEVIDGFHGSEVTYLKMLLKMVEANSVLKNVINLAQLKSDLEKAKNKYEVYER